MIIDPHSDFTKETIKQTFEQAKIVSIDRLTGRVTLFVRNGLVTTGSSLYDLSALREGMTVLIGRDNDTYVIINKMGNIPRNGLSYSMIKPVYLYLHNSLELSSEPTVIVSSIIIAETPVVLETSLFVLSPDLLVDSDILEPLTVYLQVLGLTLTVDSDILEPLPVDKSVSIVLLDIIDVEASGHIHFPVHLSIYDYDSVLGENDLVTAEMFGMSSPM